MVLLFMPFSAFTGSKSSHVVPAANTYVQVCCYVVMYPWFRIWLQFMFYKLKTSH